MGHRMRAGRRNTLEKTKPSALPMPAAESLMASHGRRNWAAMGKERLLAYAKEFIAEKGLRGRKELEKADAGRYQALRTRKLLEVLKLKNKRKDWTGMQNEELVGVAEKYLAEEGITGKRQLRIANHALYSALRTRGLLGSIGLENRNRDWAGMGNRALIAYAKQSIRDRRVAGRAELSRVDGGLYYVLSRRGLLDKVFRELELNNHRNSVECVIDAVESFGN